MAESKSPLKDKPLRNPGQSVREQRIELVIDKILGPFIFAAIFMVWAMQEWWRFYFPSKPEPIVPTAFAILAVFLAGFRLRR